MGTLKKSKDHALASLEIKDFNSKGKLKMKDKKPKSDSEDEGSYSIDEGSNSKKKGNKKGRSKCTYCKKPSHIEKYFFIIYGHIESFSRMEQHWCSIFCKKRRKGKFYWSQGKCHTMQFKGNDCHDSVERINFFLYVSDFYTHSDISK